MTLLPHKRETIVLPFSAEEALFLIEQVTEPVSRVISKGNDKITFNGMIYEETFKVSKKVDYPQNYLPIIVGKIEDTKLGSIIFLEYELFFSSKMFLSLWTVLSILIGAFFFFFPKQYDYALISVGTGALNYVISLLNFNKQVKHSREELCRALQIA